MREEILQQYTNRGRTNHNEGMQGETKLIFSSMGKTEKKIESVGLKIKIILFDS